MTHERRWFPWRLVWGISFVQASEAIFVRFLKSPVETDTVLALDLTQDALCDHCRPDTAKIVLPLSVFLVLMFSSLVSTLLPRGTCAMAAIKNAVSGTVIFAISTSNPNIITLVHVEIMRSSETRGNLTTSSTSLAQTAGRREFQHRQAPLFVSSVSNFNIFTCGCFRAAL